METEKNVGICLRRLLTSEHTNKYSIQKNHVFGRDISFVPRQVPSIPIAKKLFFIPKSPKIGLYLK